MNEGRALDNLPRIDDPELDTVAPQQGGPAAAGPADPNAPPALPAKDTTNPDAAAILLAHRSRQYARLSRFERSDRATAFFADLDRYTRELTDDLTAIVGAEEAARLASDANRATFEALDAEDAA